MRGMKEKSYDESYRRMDGQGDVGMDCDLCAGGCPVDFCYQKIFQKLSVFFRYKVNRCLKRKSYPDN